MPLTLINTLKSYLPDILQKKIAADPTPVNRSFRDSFQAAVLFVDITGFTRLTEQFAVHGPSGAEDISAVLNDFYGQWIDIIKYHGGDIIKFAGDGLLIIWNDEDLQVSVSRAAQTALEARKKLENYRVRERTLSTRIAIGAGQLSLMGLGGVFNRWESVVTGAALTQVGRAQAMLQPGQIILSQQAWKSIEHKAEVISAPEGHMLLNSLHSESMHEPVPEIELSEDAVPALRSYIPGSIMKRIDAGQSDWLAELRRVTTLFIAIPEMSRNDDVLFAQNISQILQSLVYRYEGSVNKISVDEKGVSLLAGFGLPPFSHEDDPLRGILAAQDIVSALSEIKIECHIGITTGRLFCGVIGNEKRREYTITGDSVNVAARLMQAVASKKSTREGNPIQIFCDSETYEGTRNRVDFITLEPIAIRGKAQPVPVFVPQARHVKDMGRTALSDMIGREHERFTIAESLRALITNESRQVVIEGEAGLGKSRLIEELFRQADLMNVHILLGLGESIEHNTPYHVWKDISQKLFNLGQQESVEEQKQAFQKMLEEDEKLNERAPLLNAVLPFNLADNESTRNIIGDARATAMHQLIIERLQETAAKNPVCLVIEDVHWLDSGSWTLLNLAVQRVDPLLVVISARPMGENAPIEFPQMKNMASARYLLLAPLGGRDTETLLRQRLNVQTLPEKLISFISAKAEGHPFYSEELVYALRDGGYIEVKDSECVLTPSAANLNDLNLPGSLEGVITSRIDRMPPPHQLTLKVASVIGRVFGLPELGAIYPIKSDISYLPDYLANLERQELTILDSPDPDISYLFKHIITQEVAYNLLLFSQRRSLHRAIAEWFESAHKNNIVTYYPVLAHHWKQADAPAKAMEYLEKSGEMAFRNGAYRESIQFFSQALELSKSGPADIDFAPLQRAYWMRCIAESQMGLGDMDAARTQLQKATALLKHPSPRTAIGSILGMLFEWTNQSLHRRFPHIFVGRLKKKDKELQEAAQILAHLGYVNFIKLESLPMIYHTWRSLNISEAGGTLSPARVWALGATSAILGFIPFHTLAQQYADKALKASEQVDHPRAQMWTYLAVGTYKLGIAEWEASRASELKAIGLALSASDTQIEGNAETVLSGLEYYRGHDFNASQAHYDNLLALAKKSGNHLHLTWATYGNSLLQITRGNFEQALNNVRDGEMLDTTASNVVHLKNIRAITNWRLGQDETAVQNLTETLSVLKTLPPQVYSLLAIYRTTALLTTEIWESGKTFDGPGFRSLAEIRRTLQSIIKMLKKYNPAFPIGKPCLLYFQGRQDWLNQKNSTAIKFWEASAESARSLSMPWDEANALRELGKHSVGETAREYLQNALELFTNSHAAYDILITKALLGK